MFDNLIKTLGKLGKHSTAALLWCSPNSPRVLMRLSNTEKGMPTPGMKGVTDPHSPATRGQLPLMGYGLDRKITALQI